MKSSGTLIRDLRNSKGWTQAELAKSIGTSQAQVQRLETGTRKLSKDWATKLAAYLGVSATHLMFPDGVDIGTVPLVGYVGAGAATHRFADSQGELDRVPAPEGATEETVAVEIRGESLGSFFDQWLVYYNERHDPPTPQMVGKLCVCGLTDGRVLIKKLRRGSLPDSWTLLSQMEEPIYDVFLEWCAIVTNMTPR